MSGSLAVKAGLQGLSAFASNPMVRRAGLALAKRAGGYLVNKYASRPKRVKSETTERASSEPVTTATDVRVDYRHKRRRVSRRVIKRAKRFNTRVLKVVDKLRSPVKIVIGSAGATSATAGNQGILLDGMLLGGTVSNAIAGERDLLVMSTALGDLTTSQTQLRLKTCLVEVSLLNNGAKDIFVEVFTIQGRKPMNANGSSLYSQFGSGLTQEPAAITGGATMTVSTYGMSPFMNRNFSENFKILKKETIKLAAGASTNLSLHVRMPKVWNRDEYMSYMTSDKVTKGFMFTFYGIPDATTGAPVASGIAWNAIKTYVVESNRSAGLPNSYQTLAP